MKHGAKSVLIGFGALTLFGVCLTLWHAHTKGKTGNVTSLNSDVKILTESVGATKNELVSSAQDTQVFTEINSSELPRLSVENEPIQKILLGNPKCTDEIQTLRNELLDDIKNNKLPEERLPLFLLTGWGELVEDIVETSPNDKPWSSPTKRRQIELLQKATLESDSPLYTQLYIEACATSDIPEFCKDEDLLAAAEKYSDNLSVWLSLINFYRNQQDFEQIEALISRASDAEQLNNLQSEYYLEVFNNALTLTNSPKYSAYLMLNYASTRLYGLSVLTSYCNERGGESCFKIGEVLEQYSSRNQAKKAGVQLQIDYFRESLNITDFPDKEQTLRDIDNNVEVSLANIEIPFSDEMAYFLADNLYVKDETEYFQLVQQQALSISQDNPNLCVW